MAFGIIEGLGLLGSLFGQDAEASPQAKMVLSRQLQQSGQYDAMGHSMYGALPGEIAGDAQEDSDLARKLEAQSRMLFAQAGGNASRGERSQLQKRVNEGNIGQQMLLNALQRGRGDTRRQGLMQQSTALLGQAAGMAGQFPGTPGTGTGWLQALGQLAQAHGQRQGLSRYGGQTGDSSAPGVYRNNAIQGSLGGTMTPLIPPPPMTGGVQTAPLMGAGNYGNTPGVPFGGQQLNPYSLFRR